MPLANQTYYVLNYRLEDCPIGVTGELYIGGKGLAQGYYRDPEKTAEAFIEHPAYGRIYRTGDYGVMTEKGYIIFQGRKDYQVKISGHRIELGEIESRLLQHKSVRKCAVVDWEDENKKKYSNDPQIAAAIEEIEKKMEGNGRVLIRPSGTEPLVRVMIEGDDEVVLDQMARGLADLIEEKFM